MAALHTETGLAPTAASARSMLLSGARVVAPGQDVTYPDRDGRPLAETQAHLDQIIYLVVALQQFFAAAPDVFVAGDLLLYYVEGDKRKRVAPDVFIARGVKNAKQLRRTYLLWDEGATPEVIFEITSAGTIREDLETKHFLYHQLGVREYFLFDPLGEYLRPSLLGYRLIDGSYQQIDADAAGTVLSDTLGLELRLRDRGLRLFDPQTGEWLLSPDELAEARRLEARGREEEARGRVAAETRAATAEVELARLRMLLDQRGTPERDSER